MGRGRPPGAKQRSSITAARAEKKRAADAEAERQGAAKKANFFVPRTHSKASAAPASSGASSSSSAAASSSSASSASDGTPPAPPLLIAGADGAGAGLADIHMAVENEQALGDLHAQRAELVEQHGAVLEQVPEPAGAPGVPEVPVTPEAPEAP